MLLETNISKAKRIEEKRKNKTNIGIETRKPTYSLKQKKQNKGIKFWYRMEPLGAHNQMHGIDMASKITKSNPSKLFKFSLNFSSRIYFFDFIYHF